TIMLFPLPIPIKAKYIVIFTAAIETAYLLLSHFALFYLIQLLGLAAGYIWFATRHASRTVATRAGIGRGLSDRLFDVPPPPRESFLTRMKNSFHRWKRRRMAKKFEVYMRKHDRTVFFDEHGNYKGHEPPEKDKENGGEGRGGWVN